MAKGKAKEKTFLSVYRITREYGGPEEGGWWYNDYQLVDSREVEDAFSDEAESVKTKFQEKYQNDGDIYSVLGGVWYHFDIEHELGQSTTTERPMYE